LYALAGVIAEAHEHVEREPAHRVGRGEVLRDAHERDAGLVEPVHHLREVEERSREAIDLVDDHDVDALGIYVGEEALEGGTLDVGARETAVVVVRVNQRPALAPRVRLAGLALRVERIELLLEPVRCRLAGVDRAAARRRRDLLRDGPSHGPPRSA
jgi:hypothetical protein